MKLVKSLLQFEQQILGAMLLMLHSLIWYVDSDTLRFPLFFILYGLFLLWQPLWHKDTRIDQPKTIVPILLLLVLSYFYPDEALIFFSLLITGLIGSRLFGHTSTRGFDLLALVIITLEMAIGIIPLTFAQINLPIALSNTMPVIVLLPILTFFFAPVPDRSQQTHSQIDLMHGVLTATMIFIVLLGGIVINILYGVEYTDGLLLFMFIVATLSIGISWFWNPGVGYSGLGVLWNRYAMTIGGPFETWINTLTTLIEDPYISSSDFLQAACDNLIENEWLHGIIWKFDGFVIGSGEKQGVEFRHPLSDTLQVSLFFKSDPGQALRQHTILLIRMAYQFYLSKMNQEKMRAQEHFETIHHTGARLTHDIKNILQSIKTSINIVQFQPDEQQPLPLKLLQQNLQQISTRLESTLAKLKAPELSTSVPMIPIKQWYANFQQANNDPKIIYRGDIESDHGIPPDLFDSVINNLISNALNKPEVSEVIVDLTANEAMIVIAVCDNGLPVKAELEGQLFHKPVSSGQGMGIGLYQSAFMANTFNFELELANNIEGHVCFSLFQHLVE